MSTIIPEGDDLRKAVAWVDEMIQCQSDKSISDLISEASLKFDLPPNDQEFLFRNFCKKE